MTLVQVTYDDGTTEDVVMREAAFGLGGVSAHGPVVEARISPNNTRVDRSPDGSFPNHTRLSRSYVPIYGTGRERR